MLMAMCARTLFHAHQYNTHCQSGQAECDHLDWQKWLDNVLLVRLQTLAQDYPSPTNSCDPTLLFASCLAQATIVYLCREMQSIEWPDNGGRGIPLVAEYQQRALAAVEHTLEFARSLTDFPPFKVSNCFPLHAVTCYDLLTCCL